ncbi:alpha/beta hydrolase [Patescibacteria group bacterium]|nr:alpha/beta hydrolase [Patescibacteria group bacterium]MBU1448884.1 alpha/beta hydrolase [Patescibacteria group bacterium]MBU2612932.1 alpha/beta hydrolase [Patescibacteria group bacterium]
MNHQVLVIHGGNTFRDREEYLADLETQTVTLDDLRKTGWKSSLGAALGEDFEVFQPRMPNAGDAKYPEWKTYFGKILPLMDPGVLLVGHSLGGVFLAKYLAEETVPQRIKATSLVSAPYWPSGDEATGGFDLPASLEKFSKQGGETFLYHSRDDEVVPFADLEKYQKALPHAHVRIGEGRGHYNTPDFPELVEDIKGFES